VRLKGQMEKIAQERDETDRRYRALRLQSGLGSRLSIVTAGEVPVTAFYNPAKKFTAAGAAAGAALPLGVLVLIGLSGGTYRLSRETEQDVARGGGPLLGVLPTLPHDVRDFGEAADVAHCVHQIRARLQNGRHWKGRGV